MSDAGNGGDFSCVGAGDIWEISVPSSHFCYKHKTALKMSFKGKEYRKRVVKPQNVYHLINGNTPMPVS